MIELEKKVLLSRAEYFVLLSAFPEKEPTNIQINYYFDTSDLSMNKKGITCRIRQKNGKYKTTIKKHNFSEPEKSLEQDLAIHIAFDDTEFTKLGLSLQGSFITKRTILFTSSDIQVVLDYNMYLRKTDYELEIEYQDGYEQCALVMFQHIWQVLINADVYDNSKEDFMKRIGTGTTKSARFFAAKMGQSPNYSTLQ